VVSLAARLRLRALALPSGLLALRPPPSSESPSMFRSGQPAGSWHHSGATSLPNRSVVSSDCSLCSEAA
jgi:hypothetical protein